MDVFQAALEAIFASAFSFRATYTPAGGDAVPTRAILSQPSVEAPFGGGSVVLNALTVQLMRSAVPEPAEGATIQRLSEDGETVLAAYVVSSEPMLDVEGTSWTVDVRPA